MLAVGIGLLFIIMLVQVFARVILNLPTTWTVELGRVLFMFVVFFGSSVLFIGNSHMQIEFSNEKLSEGFQKNLRFIRTILILVFFAAFLKGCIDKMIENWCVCIPTLEWMRMGYVYLLLSISAVITIGILCVESIEMMRKIK